MPPQAHGVKVISIGMFTPGNAAVVWRGPMLHRALQQFLADVYWGDLDVLLLDLPPGTGDVAISLAQLLPNAEILVVTTPQTAAAEVAERAGAIACRPTSGWSAWSRTCPGWSCRAASDGGLRRRRRRGGRCRRPGHRHEVPLLGQIPLDTRVREGGDAGIPIVLAEPDSDAGKALRGVADALTSRSRGLAGRSLSITPSGRSGRRGAGLPPRHRRDRHRDGRPVYVASLS